MRIIILGAPGSGKGTQSEMISSRFLIPIISTGAIFRENVANGTELGKKVKEILNAGTYVPDELTNALVKERLQREDCANGFILDGYPRTLPQADFLETIAKIDFAFNIEVSDSEVIKRVSGRRACICGATYHTFYKAPKKEGICDSCGKELFEREDQKEEVVRTRLKVYHEQTKPLIDFYREKNKLKEIFGEQPIEDVQKDLINFLQN